MCFHITHTQIHLTDVRKLLNNNNHKNKSSNNYFKYIAEKVHIPTYDDALKHMGKCAEIDVECPYV